MCNINIKHVEMKSRKIIHLVRNLSRKQNNSTLSEIFLQNLSRYDEEFNILFNSNVFDSSPSQKTLISYQTPLILSLLDPFCYFTK